MSIKTNKQLEKKLSEQIENNSDLNLELNYTYSLLSTLIHHSDLNPIINNLKSKVRIKENNNDKRRQKKLDFLLKNVTTENYAKISITNFTKENVVIPEKINRILE